MIFPLCIIFKFTRRPALVIKAHHMVMLALLNFGDLAHAGGIGFGQIHDFEQCRGVWPHTGHEIERHSRLLVKPA